MQTARAWLNLLGIDRQRAPLHIGVLLLGLCVTFISALLNQGASTPTPVVVSDVVESAIPPTQVDELADLPVPMAEATPRLTKHVIESGDTLKSLSDSFGVSIATIVAANNLTDPDLISVGEELLVPLISGVLHTIKQDETLGQVAERYGVDPTELASANQMSSPNAAPILTGQKLIVPGIEPAMPETKPRAVAAVQSTTRRDAAEPEKAFASLTGTASEASAEPNEKSASAKLSAKSPVVYEVQDGDSIRDLANQFGVSISTILMANNINDPDLITPGTKLKVLPVSGVEHEIEKGESLADIAAAYKVDMGPIIDFNTLGNPDMLKVGEKIVIPGASARVAVSAEPNAPAAAAGAPSRPAAPAIAQSAPRQAAPANQPAVRAPAVAPAIAIPAPIVGAGGSGVLQNAMSFQGYRYVFGGSSPAGFDCSGFVFYVHKAAGVNISRGMWGQLNGGPRIARENLQPGDTVFFANTYMPGLSHNGIYIGGGRFIHAIDERSGVGISGMNDGYWSGRYVGATRLW